MTPAAAVPTDATLLREVEDFLYDEAELADNHRYDEWLDLWTEDGLYWVPCNAEQIDPARQISIIFQDREQIASRIFRLKGRYAHAQSPRSRLSRVVSNIRLKDFDPLAGGIVASNFVLVEMRLDHQTLWAGRVRHKLVRLDGRLRMKEKHVFLLNNDAPMDNLQFLI